MDKLDKRITEVLNGLNETERVKCQRQGLETAELWRTRARKKYIALDCGTSGAFLIERSTGELYNIKGYGVADRNKKRKADIGNIFTCNPAELHRRRYNYLR